MKWIRIIPKMQTSHNLYQFRNGAVTDLLLTVTVLWVQGEWSERPLSFMQLWLRRSIRSQISAAPVAMQVRGDGTNGEDKQSKRRWHVVCALSASSALQHTRELGARAGIYNENVHKPVNKRSDEKKKRDGGKPNPNTVHEYNALFLIQKCDLRSNAHHIPTYLSLNWLQWWCWRHRVRLRQIPIITEANLLKVEAN